MVITTYNSTEGMIKKLQLLKGRTKLKFYQNSSNYYDEGNFGRQSGTFHFEEDPFSKKTQGISKIYHEVLLLMKFLQTKPPVKNMNINYCDLYYTVIKSRDKREIVNEKDENSENEYILYDVSITPNRYIGRDNEDVIIRYRKMRSQINLFKYFLLYKWR